MAHTRRLAHQHDASTAASWSGQVLERDRTNGTCHGRADREPIAASGSPLKGATCNRSGHARTGRPRATVGQRWDLPGWRLGPRRLLHSAIRPIVEARHRARRVAAGDESDGMPAVTRQVSHRDVVPAPRATELARQRPGLEPRPPVSKHRALLSCRDFFLRPPRVHATLHPASPTLSGCTGGAGRRPPYSSRCLVA